MLSDRDPVVFALGSSHGLGEAVSSRLGRILADHEERLFDGGEQKICPLVEVSDRDVYVLHSLHGEPDTSANDKLIRLLFFIATLKDAGAGRVTAICPYFAYSRNDRRTKPRDSVASRYVAQLLESVGLDRMVTVDVHNVGAFENAFRHCRAINIPLARLMAAHIAVGSHDTPLAVMSPDAGGIKRTEILRLELQQYLGRPVTKAMMDKHRSEGTVSGSLFAGDVEGRTVIICDDIISSGATILRAVQACRNAGARRVVAAATHGLFTAASPVTGTNGPDELIVSDSVALPDELPGERSITVLPLADLLAKTVERLHQGTAISDLLSYS